MLYSITWKCRFGIIVNLCLCLYSVHVFLHYIMNLHFLSTARLSTFNKFNIVCLQCSYKHYIKDTVSNKKGDYFPLGKGATNKNLEFSRFGLNHPPTLVIAKKSGKNKIFIILKWFLSNFEQFWKNLFFQARKYQNTWCWPNVSCHTLYG